MLRWLRVLVMQFRMLDLDPDTVFLVVREEMDEETIDLIFYKELFIILLSTHTLRLPEFVGASLYLRFSGSWRNFLFFYLSLVVSE